MTQDQPFAGPGSFLDHLAGEWTLSGTMGSIPLHQSVSAHWVLNNQFLRLHTLQTDTPPEGRPRYESYAYIGYHQAQQRYVMTLMDVFGGQYAETTGLGSRTENAITFVFAYPDGPLHNAFIYDATEDTWHMDLTHQTDDGGWEPFATKHLARDA